MYLDVLHLKSFYDQPLGGLVRQTVGDRVRLLWPTLDDRRVLGIGYATPYLWRFLGEAERVMACMPAAQGVINWPPGGRNLSYLSEEDSLPLSDSSVDNVLIVHGLDMTSDPQSMLREVWRILAPAGRLITITANRRGLWSRTESSPFGYGHPYTRSQINALLTSCDFQPGNSATLLHVPPTNRPLILRSNRAFERLGSRFWPRFGGLVIVEAQKQIPPRGLAVSAKKRRPTGVFKPAFAAGGNVGFNGEAEKPLARQQDSESTKASR
ncbi:MAG: class I SAM-dependent methyltransferase [Stappiaceae bacterium]